VKKVVSFVLTSLRDSTYGKSTSRLCPRCGLEDGHFGDPAGMSDSLISKCLLRGLSGLAPIFRMEEPFSNAQTIGRDFNQLIGAEIFQGEFQ